MNGSLQLDILQHKLLEGKEMLQTQRLDHILLSIKPMTC